MNSSNKILSLILILVGLFVVILFTRVQFQDYSLYKEDIRAKQAQLDTLQKEVTDLQDIQKKMKSDKENIAAKFAKEVNEDEILSYIYEEFEKGKGKIGGQAIIKSLSISEGKKNELGFMESNINLTFTSKTKTRIESIIKFLVNNPNDEAYKFFIPSFTLQEKSGKGIESLRSDYNVSIPLKMFYK